ncbi:MAG: hypothetical protein IM550_17940 [Microcystis sp. M54BS1]|nr:hypothetical protein [Microcystis sp. M54BS1]
MEQKDAAFQQTISTILSVPNWIVMLSLFSAWLVFVAFVDKLEVKKLVS